MSFAGVEATLCFLMRLQLPDHTVLLSEGGTVVYESETYTPDDNRFGIITDFSDFTSGSADEAPAFELTMAPPAVVAATTLSDPENQGSPIKFTVVSINRATGAVLSAHTIFTGILDYTLLELGEGSRSIKVGFTTEIDRFFRTDKGNRLSPAFHKTVHPGETGLDLMSGTEISIPWGDNGPRPRINGYSSGGGPGFTGGFGGGFGTGGYGAAGFLRI